MDSALADRLRARLVAWYDATARDLPWRRTRDPWAIWVSEVMLQQTRVDTAIPYWERFLARFPTPAALAEAAESDVLGLWQGLGYYSRARNLQRAARVVAAEHAGRVPDTALALRRLPGIGRYTAGAIASIAHDAPEPIVDGNVARVLQRLFGIEGDARAPAVAARLWDLAGALVPGRAQAHAQAPATATATPSRFNQALMELGALVCTPVDPRCLLCPLRADCVAQAAGTERQLGGPQPRTPPRPVARLVAAVRREGRWLWARRSEGLLRGLWELPGLDANGRRMPATAALAEHLSASCGIAAAIAPAALGEVTHVFTHRRMTARLHQARALSGRARAAAPYDAVRWDAREPDLPLSKLARKTVRLLPG